MGAVITQNARTRAKEDMGTMMMATWLQEDGKMQKGEKLLSAAQGGQAQPGAEERSGH